MKLKNALTDDEILQLARLPETGSGTALLKVLMFEEAKAQEDYNQNPMVADDKRDFRYKAGLIAGIQLAKKASLSAGQMVKKSENKETAL